MNLFRSPDADQPLVELIYQNGSSPAARRSAPSAGDWSVDAPPRPQGAQSNIPAVVTVADDGVSSGKLREQLGVPAVGDIRNCIVALADAEPLMAQLLQYRFPESERTGSSTDSTTLGGHAVGNLLIAALTAVEGGDFEEGVRQMNRVLAVRGQVLPVSPTPLTLHCEDGAGVTVDGQSAVARTEGIERVWVTPGDVAVSEDAVRAIAEADLVILGPGSLYTSILPSLLLDPIREAVLASPALRPAPATWPPRRRDRRLRPGSTTSTPERQDGGRDRRCRPREQQRRVDGPAGRGEAVRPRRFDGDVPCAGPRRRRRPGGPDPSRSGAPRRRDHPDRRPRGRGATADRGREDRVRFPDLPCPGPGSTRA
jgi:hypothetical protein